METKRPQSRKRAKATNIRVVFPEDAVIKSPYAWQTMAAVVEIVGPHRVMEMDLARGLYPLVTEAPLPNLVNITDQKRLASGYYLYTKSSTIEKKMQIEEMLKVAFPHVAVKVEII